MANFKVGDRVQLLKKTLLIAPDFGDIGVVKDIEPNSNLCVCFDRFPSLLYNLRCVYFELVAAVNSSASSPTNPQHAIAQSIYEEEIYPELLPNQAAVSPLAVCDCGGERVYGKEANLHSDWCSKLKGSY